MQRSFASGPSRRWSPASLDPTMFGARAEQSLASQYDYAPTPTATTTADAYYPYTMEHGHTNYTQAAASSYYTHAASTSTVYQYPNDLGPANNQQSLQPGISSQSAPTDWSSSAYHDYSTKLLADSSSNSARPYGTAAGSSSNSQYAPRAKPYQSKKGPAASEGASQPTVSASHARPGDAASSGKTTMTSMMGRMRLPIAANTHAEATPLSSVVGDKRKDRSSPPLTSSAEASPVKKKKEALRVKEHRKNRTQATAELAKRLPSHLQVYEAPSVKHIRQAIIHIDEQSARIARLEDVSDKLKTAQVQLVSETCVLRRENARLLRENGHLRHIVEEKDTRIRK